MQQLSTKWMGGVPAIIHVVPAIIHGVPAIIHVVPAIIHVVPAIIHGVPAIIHVACFHTEQPRITIQLFFFLLTRT